MKGFHSGIMSRYHFAILAIIIVATGASAKETLEGFLETHCVSCHGPEKEKGDLRIDLLSRNFRMSEDSHFWAEVIEKDQQWRDASGGRAQPTQEEIANFVAELDAKLKEGKAARMAARPAVAHYRLSRKEYQNTVYDLLGVRYDPTKPGQLNEDTLWHGFERIGSQLSLSPSHIDRYYRAAEIVLDRAFPPTSSEARKIRKTARNCAMGRRKTAGSPGAIRYQATASQLLFPGRVQPALQPHWFGKTGPEHSGLYKLRLQASGIRPPGGQPAHLSIGRKPGRRTWTASSSSISRRLEDNPQIYEFEVFLEMPTNLDFAVVATDGVDRRGGAAFRNAIASERISFYPQ